MFKQKQNKINTKKMPPKGLNLFINKIHLNYLSYKPVTKGRLYRLFLVLSKP